MEGDRLDVTIALEIENAARSTVTMTVPDQLMPRSRAVTAAGGRVELSFTAMRWGRAALGPLHVTALDRPGLRVATAAVVDARWALLALVAAAALAGAGPLSWLVAPGLVGCAQGAFAGSEMRAAPVEGAGLLQERLVGAATVTVAAALTTALVAGLAGAQLPGGAIVTVAGLLAAAAASALVAVRRRR